MYKIEMNNITKKFGTLIANDNINLKVKDREIHAILGENGAGKSTLMSILFGLYQPDKGEIKIDGKKVIINNPNDANNYNIGMVHQHFKLVENFSVLENVILGVENVSKLNKIDYSSPRKEISKIVSEYKLNLNLDSKISDLTVGQQQRVEILKMLYRNSDILIFDEPTAVLTPQEIIELMKIMKNFTKEGKTIILITHKLNEIKEVADRTTVLRRGKQVGVLEVKNVSTQEMAELMVGRKINFNIDKNTTKKGSVVLEVKNLTLKKKNIDIVKKVSFSLKEGEILGVAGIDGNGQTECVYGLTGISKISDGKVMLNSVDITNSSIRERYNLGMSHIPEDRQKYGVVLDFDLKSNLVLQEYYTSKFQNKQFLKFNEIKSYSDDLIEKFDIRSERGSNTFVRSMSGGNQQKAIVAREMSRKHNCLVAVQPTRGLDVGAIEYIHKRLLEDRENKKGILLFSLELDEIFKLSDRILVMYEGEIVGEFNPTETSKEELGLYMSGAKKGNYNENI